MKNQLFLLSLILSAGCGSNPNDQRPHETERISLSNDTLTYTYQDFIKTSRYIIEHEDTVDTSFYRITYPQFTTEAFNSLIKSSIWIEGEDNSDDAAQNFIEGYEEFVEDPSTQMVTAPWFKDVRSIVCVNTPRVLSLKTEYYQYTGGAHGNTVVLWANYDILKKKKITLPDIIAQDKYTELTQMAEKEFRKLENLADTASLGTDFFFEDGIFVLNDNFGFTKNSLIFFFNEYEIKPYSEGNTRIELPYTDLGDILNTQGRTYIKSIQ